MEPYARQQFDLMIREPAGGLRRAVRAPRRRPGRRGGPPPALGSRPGVAGGGIGVEMSDEQVSGDVAHVRFPGGCGAPDQGVKDEIMGVPRQSVPGLRDVVEVAREPAVAAFAPLASPRVGPP